MSARRQSVWAPEDPDHGGPQAIERLLGLLPPDAESGGITLEPETMDLCGDVEMAIRILAGTVAIKLDARGSGRPVDPPLVTALAGFESPPARIYPITWPWEGWPA